MENLTAALAEWSSSLEASDIPEGTARRAGWQWASVVGAVFAGADHPHSQALGAVARRSGGDGPATLLPDLEPTSVEAAVWANAARSVLLDFDDYLFAGHTGHSAVLVSLALGEQIGSSGADLLAPTVARHGARCWPPRGCAATSTPSPPAPASSPASPPTRSPASSPATARRG